MFNAFYDVDIKTIIMFAFYINVAHLLVSLKQAWFKKNYIFWPLLDDLILVP